MQKKETETKKNKKTRLPRFLKILGPGIITGAADDDPSGIATYSQTGAKFGYGQLWTVIFLYPLMTAVQEASARIGAVTKKGIAAVIKERYGKKVLFGAVSLIIIANTINIGADIGAMAAALNLIFPLPFTLTAVIFAVLILALEIFMPYKTYSRILKFLALTLLVYPLTLFAVRENWIQIIKTTVTPHIEFSFEFLFIFTGVVGTTISPYMFFWQASEEIEEEIKEGIGERKKVTEKFLRNMRVDNAIGMFLSQFLTWCVIVLTGTVLHQNGVQNIETAADAARALVPLVNTFPNAGLIAEIIFAGTIIGLGLVAVPVLAGSAAYAIAETFSWHEGLYRKFRDARGFYGVIIFSTLIGLLINFAGINPIKALVFTAVINGIITVPILFLILKISSDEKIVGAHQSGLISKTLIWITIISLSLSLIAMVKMMI